MRKLTSISVLLLCFAMPLSVSAANWYVHKGASGSNNGTDWNNAWNEMNQIGTTNAPACGDTIWLAGGTYTTNLTMNKTCTAGNVLTFNRVLSTDSVPTAAAGWNAAFDSQVIFSGSEILVRPGAYNTVSGRKGSYATNDLGISVQCTTDGCEAIGCANGGGPNCSANEDHITIAYVEAFGPPCAGSDMSCTNATDGVNLVACSFAITNLTLDHLWVHRWVEGIRTCNWNSGDVLQYSTVNTIHPGVTEHEDVIYNFSSSGSYTIRYSLFFDCPNDGIFFDFGSTGLTFYGNVYWHAGNALMTFKTGFTFGTLIMYNNTFENDGASAPGAASGSVNCNGTMGAGSIVENNVFENITQSCASQSTSDYNAYSTSIGSQDSGTHSFTYACTGSCLGASPLFINESPSNPIAADFHLTTTGKTTLQNGLTLSAPYTQDRDGNTRGASGHWYIGAYDVGGAPAVSFNPSSIAFGNQPLNVTSAQQQTTLTNTGTAPLTISSVTLTGANPAQFAFTTPSSGSDCRTVGTVAAGANCVLAVTFTPAFLLTYTATISAADNATGSPQLVTLSGLGLGNNYTVGGSGKIGGAVLIK